MARRKLEERHTRKLIKAGGGRSTIVTLPAEIVRALKWRGGQKVVVSKRGSGMYIADWKPKK